MMHSQSQRAPAAPADGPVGGDLLELLHDALGKVTTLKAEYRDWSRPAPSLSLVAEMGGSEGEGLAPRLRWGGPGPFSRPREARRTIHLNSAGQLRVEVRRNGRLERLGLCDGANWWRWSEERGADSGDAVLADGHWALPPLLDPPLLTPARLPGWLRLSAAGTAHRAGRRVLCARGAPRKVSTVARQSLSYELEFDAEHGMMLRLAAFVDQQCVHLTEAIMVEYGCELDSELFVWPPKAMAELAPTGLPARASDQQRTLGLLRGAARDSTRRLGKTTVWLTGLPGAGKTTLARALERELTSRGAVACVLDGDEIRTGLSRDLGLSRGDRAEQARRVAHVAVIVAGTGAVAIVALVSPFAADRERAREIHEQAGTRFIEVWVDTPTDICEARDPKGLYAAACAGRLQGLTGYDAPYEQPRTPDLRISGCDQSSEVAAARIAALMFDPPDAMNLGFHSP